MSSTRKKPPAPLLLAIPVVLVLLSMSVAITMLLGLPLWVPIPTALGLILGIPILGLGTFWMAWTLRCLTPRRAFGGDLYKAEMDSLLVTTGPYAYSRNPVYLSAMILFLGWFFVLRWTPIVFTILFFFGLFVVIAKWEEKELAERFGDRYRDYRQRVPFMVPRPAGGGKRE